jgi:hypothetical protein
MHRLLAVLLAAVTLGVAASPASAADHCRPRPGEHQLARSAQAVVFDRTIRQSQHFPLQTITGCSRRSGKRRTIDTLQRQSVDDPTKLVGLRLAATRVAYVIASRWGATPISDDALHGGRRHGLLDAWPFDTGGTPRVLSWAVDAEGDVALILRGDAPAGVTELVVWRRGLGTRLVDARATITGVRLHGRTLTWRRNGVSHVLDLTRITRSACGHGVGAGTLTVDVSYFAGLCLRSSGALQEEPWMTVIVDANGPYVIFRWATRSPSGTTLVDLAGDRSTNINYRAPFLPESPGPETDAVVTDHGLPAWIADGRLWVRDAAGTRAIPGTGTGPLLRDGDTVTWSGGGPTVTLMP